MTAALVPGAAVFVQPAYACTLIQPETPGQFVPEAEVIVIGDVLSAGADAVVLRPEAFLKGPASAEEIRFGSSSTDCPRASLSAGDRALVYVFDASAPTYPLVTEVYVLKDGHASMEGAPQLTEVEVVSQIRALTGQYAVPAATEAEGAGIDWDSTVLPLGIALLIIFGIGLVLMRVWHRIDPS